MSHDAPALPELEELARSMDLCPLRGFARVCRPCLALGGPPQPPPGLPSHVPASCVWPWVLYPGCHRPLVPPRAPAPPAFPCITLFLPGSPSQGTCLPASCPLPGVSATRKGAKASYQAPGSSLEAFPAKHQCSAWPVAPLNSGVVPPDSACTSFPRAVPRGSSEGRQGPCSPSCEDNIRRLRGVCR